MSIALLPGYGEWIVLLMLVIAAGVVILLRRSDRARPGVDHAIQRYWDTTEHSSAWEEERQEEERQEEERRRTDRPGEDRRQNGGGS